MSGDQEPLKEGEMASDELDELGERLRKQGWYLGEMSIATAASVLTASSMSNSFVVYRCPDMDYKFIVSARFHVDDLDEDVFEDLPIETTETGKYNLVGQSESFDDIVEVVSNFARSTNPPLRPALRMQSVETQLSLTDAPPDYDKANKVLKPDIAPLPNIEAVKVEDAKEAEVGRISPGSSLQLITTAGPTYNYTSHPNERPSYLSRSIWHKYEDRHRCHPKNVCHGCCHRPEEWTGYRVVYKHKWYDCRGSGPLRVLGLLLFYLVFGLCFGSYKMCSVLCKLLLYFCCYGDSWS